MPYIVAVVDELSDSMLAWPKEMEPPIIRLTQMSRAVGIHIILSTSRSGVKVFTGLIIANTPARAAFQTASQKDSRTILDTTGAEKLRPGDMLFLARNMGKPIRVQVAYISDEEIEENMKRVKEGFEDAPQVEVRFGTDNSPIFSSIEEGVDDYLYQDAKRVVIEAGKASTSYLQRKLGVGYARAAMLMDMLENTGVIGPANGATPREVLEKN